MIALVVFCAFGCGSSLLTRSSPTVEQKATVATPTPAEVLALHKQLGTIADKFETMLSAKDGAIAHSKAGASLKVFLKELKSVLKSTDADQKLPAAVAMEKLLAAKQSLGSLMGDFSSRQEALMKEDNAQRESLLLGILMTRQKEPMDQQLEILKDDDFSGLEVSKALLAKHNATAALYVQVAGYLDTHPNRKPAPMREAKPSDPKAHVAAVLEKHLATLEHEYEVHEGLHKRKVEELVAKAKNATAKQQRLVHIMEKREERNFKKWAAMKKHDINAMKDALDGVKKGDMKAIARARAALQASLKTMQSQSGGFLYLIQLGHTLMKRDCPYCAAQCVDKCHEAGKPYVQCLTDCADAGKGQ